MDLLTHMREDEESCLRARLGDDELARKIAGADIRTAVSLLLQARNRDMIFAIVLWRQRTGDDLKTSMTAVDAISDAIKRGEEIAPA